VPGGCAAISLQWGGDSASSANIQIPSTLSVPEFGVSSVFVAAFAMLGVVLLRRGKMNWTH
jgi:hypothetical protein